MAQAKGGRRGASIRGLGTRDEDGPCAHAGSLLRQSALGRTLAPMDERRDRAELRPRDGGLAAAGRTAPHAERAIDRLGARSDDAALGAESCPHLADGARGQGLPDAPLNAISSLDCHEPPSFRALRGILESGRHCVGACNGRSALSGMTGAPSADWVRHSDADFVLHLDQELLQHRPVQLKFHDAPFTPILHGLERSVVEYL